MDVQGALKNFAKFKGKHLCRSLYFNKATGIFFIEHLQWMADVALKLHWRINMEITIIT